MKVKVLIGTCITLVACLVMVTVWAFTRQEGRPTGSSTSSAAGPRPTSTPGAASTSGSTGLPVGGPVNGCLGGVDPETAITTARDTAPPTQSGAVEFYVTLVRWMNYAPKDLTKVKQIAPTVASPAGVPVLVQTASGLANPSAADFSRSHYRVQAQDGRTARVFLLVAATNKTGDGMDEALLIGDVQLVEGKWRVIGGPAYDEAGITDPQTYIADFKTSAPSLERIC